MPHLSPETVLQTMSPQLVPDERASSSALLAHEAYDEPDEVDDGDEPALRGKRQSSGPLKQIIGRRIAAARQLNGMGQFELAQALGFENQTQVSLWEQGRRLPPLYCVIGLSTQLAVSVDFLLGLDESPERDSATAARNSVVRRMSGLLERHASAVADVLLQAGRFDPVPQLRASRIVSTVAGLCDSVARFRALNPKMFDNAPAGAMLLRTARDAREASDKVAGLLDASDRRIEFALERGREALVAPVPESLPADS